jgi:hypothetical protein
VTYTQADLAKARLEGRAVERLFIIKLLKTIAGETCDGPVHIITSTCLCDLTALIEGKKK